MDYLRLADEVEGLLESEEACDAYSEELVEKGRALASAIREQAGENDKLRDELQEKTLKGCHACMEKEADAKLEASEQKAEVARLKSELEKTDGTLEEIRWMIKGRADLIGVLTQIEAVLGPAVEMVSSEQRDRWRAALSTTPEEEEQ